MYINWFTFILGLYFLFIYFSIKKKHKLAWVLPSKYLTKAESIKNIDKLEYDISIIQLIFAITCLIVSIIKPNTLIDIAKWIILGLYLFKLSSIRKKVLHGFYD